MIRPTATIGFMERTVCLRSGWVLGFGLVFGAGAVALASVSALSGTASPGLGFDRTSATLLNLMLLVVPLAALLLGTQATAGSRAMWEMLASQPVPISTLVVGKWLGVWMSIGGAIAVALGAAGAFVGWWAGAAGSQAYVTMGLAGMLLAAGFSAVGVALGAALPDRLKAMAAAVLVWIGAVFLYDWLVMGVALISGRQMSLEAVWVALFLNPADLARVAAVAGMGALDLLGPTGVVLYRAGPLTQLAPWLGLIAWVVLPLVAATWLARRVER